MQSQPQYIVFCLLLLVSTGFGATTNHAADSTDSSDSQNSTAISPLVASLADPDPAVRTAAGEKLFHIGLPARPELLKATHADDPELRTRAAQVLRRLPWWTNDDSPEARSALQRYGQVNDAMRIQIISRLSTLDATPTLIRLLSQEPNESVRWAITFMLYRDRRPIVRTQVRVVEPAADDPAALTAAGLAWIDADHRKAMAYFKRAIDLDTARPANDSGLMILAFQPMLDAAIDGQRWDDAADLLRRQSAHTIARHSSLLSTNSPQSIAVIQLITLHEYVGPLRGFQHDLETLALPAPQSSFAAGLFAQLGIKQPTPAALTASFSPEDRFIAGQFLFACGLYSSAEKELRQFINEHGPNDDPLLAHADVLLAHMADRRNDLAQSAELMQQALDLYNKTNFEWSSNIIASAEDLQEELHWRLAKLAQQRGNQAAANREIALLMNLTPANTDNVIDVIVWLKETSRAPLAQQLFDRIYKTIHDRSDPAIDAAIEDNDLAWFCARCGERLDEALRRAHSAVRFMPSNAAFLDTLAEASYRKGHRDDAVPFESEARSIDPDSRFMKQQLERFKKPPSATMP